MSAYYYNGWRELRLFLHESEQLKEKEMTKVTVLLDFLGDKEVRQSEVVLWYMKKYHCTSAAVYGKISQQMRKFQPTLEKIERMENGRKVIFLKKI